MEYSEMSIGELNLILEQGKSADAELLRRKKAKYEEILRSYVGKYFAYYGIMHKKYRRFDSVGVLDGDFCAMGIEVSIDDVDEISVEHITFDVPIYSSKWVEISADEGKTIFNDIAGKATHILTGV